MQVLLIPPCMALVRLHALPWSVHLPFSPRETFFVGTFSINPLPRSTLELTKGLQMHELVFSS